MRYLSMAWLMSLFSCTLWAAEKLADISPEIQTKIASYPLQKMPDGAEYINIEKAVADIIGQSKADNALIIKVGTALAERIPAGGAIYLGDLKPRLDLRKINDQVWIGGGNITVGGQCGLQIYGSNVSIEENGERRAPMRDLVMLFGNCSHINGPVADSAFIAAVNGWGRYAFTAAAPVVNTLFLWFSINWPFADYNAHLKQPDPEWWRRNCQCHFDLKGGGKNTRVYLMIETNYGNPGTGVWLENCDGLAMYHGATERSSAQGPGCYYLKNCRNVQLGLRRIFPGTCGGGSSAMPAHALTIEGGEGNILHFFSDFANAYSESFINSDPKLQVWGAEFNFATKGLEGADILRFAYTPFANQPEGSSKEEAAKLAEENAEKWIMERGKKSGQPFSAEAVEQAKALIKSGRDAWWPINARHEETFIYAGVDLTKSISQLPGGRRLPPPPSIPPTDAPRSFRPLYFTLETDFARELLAAGADPTGNQPSDDAFAKIMYGLSAAEVQECYKAVIERQDHAAYEKLCPPEKKSGRAAQRPPLHIPAGIFRLKHTLLLLDGAGTVIGAGPDKTILRFPPDIVAIKQIGRCSLLNFAIEGGKVGVSITGADHHENAGLLRKSYIAGQNYYNITFRNQTFAGMHIGRDEIEAMGGAEHDQNKYINLKFHQTGDYGIYMNHSMLDKWLMLNGEFIGQKKAGISIKFNNLIHGGIYNCVFKDIDGPGIDFMGGNPMLQFRPYIVMVDQCEFYECGSADQPAVDYGYGELMAFLRTKIITKNKKIKTGFIGAAQHYEDVEIDVNTAKEAPAMILRAVRNGATARANGHILRKVIANGPVAFSNDANAQNEIYRKTLQQRDPKRIKDDGSLDLNWDINPAAHSLAPPNGWIHPFIFYRCRFGEKKYDYSLINADVNNNKAIASVDLSPLASE